MKLLSMKEEIWKPIIGYENYYEINNIGEIKTKDRVVYNKNGIRLRLNKAKKIKPRIGRYLMVGLNENNIQKHFLIHRLVAEHFIENKFNNKIVNHKNGNKHDNRVENLEWCTYSENLKHAFKIGLKKPTWKGKKLSEETKRKMSENKKGKPAHNKGKKQPRINI